MSLLTAGGKLGDGKPIAIASGPDGPEQGAEALDLRLTRSGAPDRRLRIQADRCTFGSGEGCTVRLGDPAVRPLHAVILTAGGRVLIRGYAIPIEINEHFALEAFLRPGDAFHLGPYRFEILAIPVTTPAVAGYRPTENGHENTLRSQWVRVHQQLEELSQRYQHAIDELEHARAEVHQHRQQIESLQQECRERADLDSHQKQVHAAELRRQQDELTTLQSEATRLREELTQARQRWERAEQEQARLRSDTAHLHALLQEHEQERREWERRLVELTSGRHRQGTMNTEQPLQPPRAEAPQSGPLPERDPRSNPPVSSIETVERRINRMLGDISRLMDDPDPERHPSVDTSPAPQAATGQLVPTSGRGIRATVAEANEVSRNSGPAAAPADNRNQTAEILRSDRVGDQATPAPASLRPQKSLRRSRPNHRVDGGASTRGGFSAVANRWNHWQGFALPSLAALLFYCGYRNPDLAGVWNAAGWMACGLTAFLVHDLRGGWQLNRWKRVTTGQP